MIRVNSVSGFPTKLIHTKAMEVTTGLTLILIYQRLVVAGVKVETQNSEFMKPQTTTNFGTITSVHNPTIVVVTESENPAGKRSADYKPEQRDNLGPEIYNTFSTSASITSVVPYVNIPGYFNESDAFEIETQAITPKTTNLDYQNERDQQLSTQKELLDPADSLEFLVNPLSYEHSTNKPNDLKYQNENSGTDPLMINKNTTKNKPPRKKGVSSFDTLKNVLKQDPNIIISNRTSPLNHSRRFRELTRRRKYSMNFVKSQNSSAEQLDSFKSLLSNETQFHNNSEKGGSFYSNHFNASEINTKIIESDTLNSIYSNQTYNKEKHKSWPVTAATPYEFEELDVKTRQSSLLGTVIPIHDSYFVPVHSTTPSLRKYRLQNKTSTIELIPLSNIKHSPNIPSAYTNINKGASSSRSSLSTPSSRTFTFSKRRLYSSTPPTSSLPKPSPTADPWPVKLAAEIPGDLILGGLMMVHEREDSITCGPIMPQGGIQALETMLYTLDVINSDPVAPFTIGAHILDDCDKDTYGLEMAVDFIKGKSMYELVVIERFL